MDVEYRNRKPQEDVPVDQIIHYIVKDYQRMFLTFNDMKERAEKAEAKIEELKAMGVDVSALLKPKADPHPERNQTYHYLPYRQPVLLLHHLLQNGM